MTAKIIELKNQETIETEASAQCGDSESEFSALLSALHDELNEEARRNGDDTVYGFIKLKI